MKKNNIESGKSLVNRVAESGLLTINLEDFYPDSDIAQFDIKDYLYKELILKEKDFRNALKGVDWEQYRDKIVLIYCSSDAIIPVWAYMLVTAYLSPVVFSIYQGNKKEFLTHHYMSVISTIDKDQYDQKRVVIKGCSNKPVPASAYAEITKLLQPVAQSIMYGEPCSTVPIFKRPRKLPRK